MPDVTPTHTPTPWYARFNGYYWDIRNGPELYDPCVAQVVGVNDVSGGQANAEHIVKCVNAYDQLVAALQNIAMDRYGRNDHQDAARIALRICGIEVK